MEDDSNNRRLLLAAALCFGVLLVWQTMIAPPPKPPPPEAPPEVAANGHVTPDDEKKGDPSSSGSARPADAAPEKPRPEPQRFSFSGMVEYDDRKVPYEVELTNVGGGIERFELPTYFERSTDNEPTDRPITLANPTEGLANDATGTFRQMAGIRFTDETSFRTPDRIVFEVAEEAKDRVVYRHVTEDGVEIEREYRFRPDAFEIEMAVTVRNRTDREQRHQLQIHSALKVTEAMRGGSGFLSNFIPPADHLQGLCHTDGGVEREDYRSLEKGEKFSWNEAVRWVAMDRQYFLSAIIARDREAGTCLLRAKDEVAQAGYQTSVIILGPGEEKRHKFDTYLGIKKQSVLTRADAELEGAVDYTILGLNLAPLCAGLLWVLGLFYELTGSWGFAIIGLTVLVRLVLFPLNQRSMRSMRAMQALKPELDAIREKYGEDRQRLSEEMMGLYRKHNVNPAGGCLPILIQMPIWFALYRSLWVSVDLYQQEFLWVSDLTTRDPYWILPVSLVVVMFLQQKMTPTTMEPMQQKIMQYTLPLFFGVMMSALPAGLCFYILVNTVLAIVQQHVINRSVRPQGGSGSEQEAKA